MIKIPFNKPAFVGNELKYINESVKTGKISGDGFFTEKVQKFIEKKFSIHKALLTTSCTHALEMACILLDLGPNDDVIVPSFTFVSTVNAIVLRGANPVFIDIRPDTLNLNENLLEKVCTRRTKAIVPVHYAGVSCEMDSIVEFADQRDLKIIEDAAQGVNSKYKGKYVGSIGHLGAYSFHETKNVMCGEGGAILINSPEFVSRAEIIREKGTNRSKFFRGEVDKYSWVDIGSSYLPSDILAAFLYAQFERLETIQNRRKKIYYNYYKNLRDLEKKEKIRLPIIPDCVESNYHIFYILLPNENIRDMLMKRLKEKGILSVFHYLPLHLSPFGSRYSYKKGSLPVTEDMSCRLLRLPLYYDLSINEQDFIIENIYDILKKI